MTYKNLKLNSGVLRIAHDTHVEIYSSTCIDDTTVKSKISKTPELSTRHDRREKEGVH